MTITREQFIAACKVYEGRRYAHMGRGPFAFDCAGLALRALKDLGREVEDERDYTPKVDGARFVAYLRARARQLPDWREARPGDLLMLRFDQQPEATHLVVVTSTPAEGGRWRGVHASAKSRRVVEQGLEAVERLAVAAFDILEGAHG